MCNFSFVIWTDLKISNLEPSEPWFVVQNRTTAIRFFSSLYLTSYMKINTHSPVGISSLHKTVRKKLCLDDWLLDDTSLWLELSTQFLLLSNILASENVNYIKMDLPRKWLLISLSNIADKYVLLQDGMNYRFSTIFL